MIDFDDIDAHNPSPEHQIAYHRALAEILESSEEQTLGPTDSAVCAKALREKLARLEAEFAA